MIIEFELLTVRSHRLRTALQVFLLIVREIDDEQQGTGREHNKSAPGYLLFGGETSAYARGENNGVRSRLAFGEEYDYAVHAHEAMHQLLTRTDAQEHAVGGALTTPAGSVSQENLDAIWIDALKSKTFKVVIPKKK